VGSAGVDAIVFVERVSLMSTSCFVVLEKVMKCDHGRHERISADDG